MLERYISCVTGKDHRVSSEEELRATSGDVDETESGKTTDTPSQR